MKFVTSSGLQASALALIVMIGVSSCAVASPEDSHPYLMLSPRSSVEVSYFGECKKLINLTKNTIAYVPTGSEQAWSEFVARDHVSASAKIVKVSTCSSSARSTRE